MATTFVVPFCDSGSRRSPADGNCIIGADILALTLGRGFLPDVASEELEIPFGNERVWVAGRQRFEAGTLSFRDYVDRDIQGLLATWYAMVYPGILTGVTDGRVGQPSDYKRDGDILMFAPDGTSLRLCFGL